jgi:hypothetical protein
VGYADNTLVIDRDKIGRGVVPEKACVELVELSVIVNLSVVALKLSVG